MARPSANCKASVRARPQRVWARNESGFTYLGLLYFMALIALSSALTMEVHSFAARRSAEDELLWVGNEFKLALISYRDSSPPGSPRNPSSLDDLVLDPRFPEVRRHIRRIYADPLTGKKNWGLIWAPEGGITGLYSTAKGIPIKIKNFPLELVQFEEAKNYQDWRFESFAYGLPQLGTPSPLFPGQQAPSR